MCSIMWNMSIVSIVVYRHAYWCVHTLRQCRSIGGFHWRWWIRSENVHLLLFKYTGRPSLNIKIVYWLNYRINILGRPVLKSKSSICRIDHFSNFKLPLTTTTTYSICTVLASVWIYIFLNTNVVLHYLQLCALLAWLRALFYLYFWKFYNKTTLRL